MCHPSRREFLKTGSLAVGAAAGLTAFRIPGFHELSDDRPYLDAALKAWRWIDASRIESDDGITWPADPLDPSTTGYTLYTHSPGVVVFLLELFHATNDSEFLDLAQRAVDHLGANVDRVDGAGLYTGLGGLLYVFTEMSRRFETTRNEDYASRAIERLVDTVDIAEDGVAWPLRDSDGRAREANDIISGTAGTALALMRAAETLGERRLVALAHDAGVRLLRRATAVDAGSRWDLWPGYPREMPNFSHGTAGVAYALAELYRSTGDAALLNAALDGASYVQSLATGRDDDYLVFHHRPDGEDLFYLGWCHGPVGTNRLFESLYGVTGQAQWLEWTHRGARGIMRTGIPEQRTPGFWENISQCGGTAGVGEFFLRFSHVTGEASYRTFADRLTDDLFRRSTAEHRGLKWLQAEHRVRPDLVVAQTGFMQGAAGVGKYFLSLDRTMWAGGKRSVILPDESNTGAF